MEIGVMEPDLAMDQVMEVNLGEEDGEVPGEPTDGLVQVQFNININNNKKDNKDRKYIINNTNNIIYQDKFIKIINNSNIIQQVHICILGEEWDYKTNGN